MNSVAIFSDTLWPSGGGGELATYLYAELMYSLGIKPVFIVNKANNSYKHIKVVKLRRLGKGKYAFTLNIKSLIKTLHNVDVAYFAASTFELIPLVKKLLNKPVVVHVHSYYPYCPLGHMYDFYTNMICNGRQSCAKCIWRYEAYRRGFTNALLSTMLNASVGRFFLGTLNMADAIIFVSEAQRKLFLEATLKKGLNISQKTQVIYNPIPDLKFVEMEGDDVGFLGGFDPIKGFKTLYQAWIKIFSKYQSNKLHVAKGYKLPREFESKGIMSYGYLKPPIEILKLIRKVRAITVPSLSPEPAPYSAVEACLYGRLLIASEVGGIPEIVGGLPGVKLVPPGNVNELSDALEWILSMNHNEAVELGLRNRENILKRFDNYRSVNELVKVFEKV
jgi:glycosyltransferase involved in cell wall biosynthesis